MRGARLWLCRVLFAVVAAASPGCATFCDQSFGETLSDCGDACTTTVALIIISPCIVAGTAGCLAGACTRCAEGPDTGEPVEDESSAQQELPLPERAAVASVEY